MTIVRNNPPARPLAPFKMYAPSPRTANLKSHRAAPALPGKQKNAATATRGLAGLGKEQLAQVHVGEEASLLVRGLMETAAAATIRVQAPATGNC